MDSLKQEALARDIMAIHMQTMTAFWKVYDGSIVADEELEDTQSWQDFYCRSKGWEIRLWNKMLESKN